VLWIRSALLWGGRHAPCLVAPRPSSIGLSVRGGSCRVFAVRDPKVDAYVRMVCGWVIRQAARPDVADALDRIERAAMIPHQLSLRLLALRRYLRIQDRDQVNLHSIWSWSEDKVRNSLREGAGRDLMNEAARVQATFARNNPGYTLGVSPPRSLARQVQLWVTSSSAHAAGEQLLRAASRELSKAAYELPPPVTKVELFATWVREFRVDPEPGNAAPGTSDHGQVRAVDFVVMRGLELVAGTTRSTIPSAWTAPGWAQRLVEATAGTRLRGPLRVPYEPWHWSLG
jgi:hypothetical protein